MLIEFDVQVADRRSGTARQDAGAVDQQLGRDELAFEKQAVIAGDEQVALRQAFGQRASTDADGIERLVIGAIAKSNGALADPANLLQRMLPVCDGADQIAGAQGFDRNGSSIGFDPGARDETYRLDLE